MKVLETESRQTLVFDPGFYRLSIRLPVSGSMSCVALWGGFRLGAGWYPRLERFWQMDDLEHNFPKERTSDSYVLQLIDVPPIARLLRGAVKIRQHEIMCAMGKNGCYGTPWSEELDGKELHGAVQW